MRKYRICMLCDTLDLGGAETHVVTLANYLARAGHAVTLVSGGGRMTGSLLNVTHITLPLYRKRAFFWLFFKLKRLFRRGRFDVIHAHTRKTAFLAHFLAKGRLVSTAHWVFNTSFPYGYLTKWGEQTLAVSEDISDYLKEEYGLSGKQITVTVNGIDPDRFTGRKKECGRRKIVCCTRMDHDRADAAFCLLRIARRLPRDSFSLVILGDGDRFTQLEQEAALLLHTHPWLDIRLLGGVSDVSAELADADIFVGVSRAALEGMTSECAVILAGNEGYLSVFDPKRAKEAEKSNFCCRGAEKLSDEKLFRDVTYLLSLPTATLRKMGQENRCYAVEHYSDAKMGADALSVYERICKRRVVLCGYFGFRNVGDTLLSRALCKRLRKNGYGQVDLLSARYLSIRALRSMRRGYDFILGGGNLLQDATSMRSLRFYLFCAANAKGRIEIYGGLGPLSPKGEALVRPLLRRADAIFCRTESDFLRAAFLGAVNASVTADAALSLPFPAKKKGQKILLAFKSPKESERAALLAFVLHLCRHFGRERLLLFVMHPDDLSFAKQIARLCRISPTHGDADRFLFCLSECCAVFSSRLHAGVCALGMEIPFFLWSGEEKCRFFCRDVARLSKMGAFSGLFSFADRPQALPSSDGMKKVKEEMLRRR